ncbi:hypothetical protein, partial [Novacetimonas cocois]
YTAQTGRIIKAAQSGRLPSIVECLQQRKRILMMSKEPSEVIHAALIHAAATLTAAKKEIIEKASPTEIKAHFKSFLHTLETGWREHEAGDHHK